ncbi:hypothetical protein SLS56_010058 [Neofusicoccum ribis]|uniref:Xylanolytic transcriptional activator regulatory domain-containing protein n=1 Tax=Neofusicoccum ribis TaxID=45134 RepID=A0ABR3SFG0_9PEZI
MQEAIDRRNDAYIYSGMALRMALTKGLHRETAEGLMDDRTRERRRKIWWTVYVLDRKFSSSMGVPLSVQDIDITVEFPQKSGSQNSTALSMNAKLSRLMTHVINKLEASFEMQLDDSAECVSRVSGSLNISYHHCIILSIRPLILYCLQKRFHENSSGQAVEPTCFTNHIHALLNACLDSARKVLTIITILYDHGLLDSFIPLDLESLFSSASVMLLMNAIVPQKNKDSSYMTNTRRLLDTMISRGNNLAKFRLQELEHMERLVSIAGLPNELPERSTAQTFQNTGDEDLQSQLRLRPRSFAAQSDIGPGLEDVQNGLTPDQIVSVADLLELDYSAFDDEIPLEDEWLWSFGDL